MIVYLKNERKKKRKIIISSEQLNLRVVPKRIEICVD